MYEIFKSIYTNSLHSLKIQYLNSPSAKPFAQTSRSAFPLDVFLWTVPTHGTHQLLYQIFSVTCEWTTYNLAVQEITQ